MTGRTATFARRALIFAFDSSYPFSVAERLLARRSEAFSLLTYECSRIPGIMEQRRSEQTSGIYSSRDCLPGASRAAWPRMTEGCSHGRHAVAA